MKNFKKDKQLIGGTRTHPVYYEIGKYKCIKCKINAKEISRKPQHSSNATLGRGRLNTDWKEITLQCPNCKKVEKYDTERIESDGSYYSNEERRVYRKY